MQSIFLSAVFLGLILLGFIAPFGAALGFVWVDIVKPQQLAYSIINGLPLSLIAAIAMLMQFALKDRKSPPKFGTLLTLLFIFSLWVTLTTMMSTVPSAWDKWDWVFKVLVFALIAPYIFRSRLQIEAFILVFIFSASTIFFSAGIKTMLGSGGYGVLAIMGSGNTGLAESSTLAAVCAMLIPLIIYVMRNSLIFPKNLFTLGLFLAILATALATVVGTAARTGIITLGVLYLFFVLKSKKKLWWLAGAGVLVIGLMSIDLSSTPWGSRMSTIETYEQDSSALGRLKVWEWTIDYVAQHPLGGGFDAYRHNRILEVAQDGTVTYYANDQIMGKAFHSIYFEILGEQGVPGFIMYFAIIIISLKTLHRLKKQWKGHKGMEWVTALADALTAAMLVFLTGGAFIGIAYQPFVFYMITITIALDSYSKRVVESKQVPNKMKVV